MLRDTGMTLAAMTVLPGCQSNPPVPMPPGDIPGTAVNAAVPIAFAVDAHCHVFNLYDLPAADFVGVAFLGEEGAPGQLIEPFVYPLLAILAESLVTASPSPDDEKQRLKDLATKMAEMGTIRLETWYPISSASWKSAEEQDLIGHVSQALQTLRARTSFQPPPGAGWAATLEPQTSFERHKRELFAHIRNHHHTDAEQDPDAAAKSLVTNPNQAGDVLGPLISWMRTQTKFRFQLAEQLTQLFNEGIAPIGQSQIKLYVPQLIDYDQWLAQSQALSEACKPNTAKAPVKCQVDVMREVSIYANRFSKHLAPDQAYARYAVHGFVAYDPRRSIECRVGQKDDVDCGHPGETPLQTVQRAIEQEGFIGVKLYPVMGFKPTDNDKNDTQFGIESLPRLAAGLDPDLNTLFDWCIAQDVPVLTHCSDTNYTFTGAGLRGGPTPWQALLNKYPTLRLNLAHFGGIYNLYEYQQEGWLNQVWDVVTGSTDALDWPAQVVAILKNSDYPNVYADFADFSDVLSYDTQAPGFDALFKMLNDDRVKTRLLYGTDWTLLGRTPNLGPFYREQKALVYNTFGQSAEAVQMFVGRNAIDYLGLAKGQKTRGRLEAFYQKYDLDTWLFDLIDAVGGSSPSSGSVTRA